MHATIAIQNSKGWFVFHLTTTEVAHRILFNDCGLGLVTWCFKVDEEVENTPSRIIKVNMNILNMQADAM